MNLIALPDLVKYKPARFLKPGRFNRCILYKRVVLFILALVLSFSDILTKNLRGFQNLGGLVSQSYFKNVEIGIVLPLICKIPFFKCIWL